MIRWIRLAFRGAFTLSFIGSFYCLAKPEKPRNQLLSYLRANDAGTEPKSSDTIDLIVAKGLLRLIEENHFGDLHAPNRPLTVDEQIRLRALALSNEDPYAHWWVLSHPEHQPLNGGMQDGSLATLPQNGN